MPAPEQQQTLVCEIAGDEASKVRASFVDVAQSAMLHVPKHAWPMNTLNAVHVSPPDINSACDVTSAETIRLAIGYSAKPLRRLGASSGS